MSEKRYFGDELVFTDTPCSRSMSIYDHPEWRAFIVAIVANRDDDTPRLVAADWLDEQGEVERAELIRQQIASCKTREADFGMATAKLVRGFFEEVSNIRAIDWVKFGDTLLLREPIRLVSLTTTPETVWATESSDRGAIYNNVLGFSGDPTREYYHITPSDPVAMTSELLRLRWPTVDVAWSQVVNPRPNYTPRTATW